MISFSTITSASAAADYYRVAEGTVMTCIAHRAAAACGVRGCGERKPGVVPIRRQSSFRRSSARGGPGHAGNQSVRRLSAQE